MQCLSRYSKKVHKSLHHLSGYSACERPGLNGYLVYIIVTSERIRSSWHNLIGWWGLATALQFSSALFNAAVLTTLFNSCKLKGSHYKQLTWLLTCLWPTYFVFRCFSHNIVSDILFNQSISNKLLDCIMLMVDAYTLLMNQLIQVREILKLKLLTVLQDFNWTRQCW